MRTTLRHRAPTSQNRRCNGFSLVELMIAMVAGLLLLAGITSLIVQQSNSRRELSRAAAQVENGRYAMQLLETELHHAGFYGWYSKVVLPANFTSITQPPPYPLTPPDPCEVAFAAATVPDPKIQVLPFAVQAWDSPSTLPAELAGCLNAANVKPGTDIFLVRRADTVSLAPTLATDKEVYMQTTQAGLVLRAAPSTDFVLTRKDGSLADLRKFRVHIYYISPCSRPTGTDATCLGTDDGGTPIPTLKRQELLLRNGVLDFYTTALVEGVEDMQIDYGIDFSGDPNDPLKEGTTMPRDENERDGAPNRYINSPNFLETASIVSARVSILARQLEPTPGYTDENKTYVLGNSTRSISSTDPDKAFKRQVYSRVVRLDNPAGRRER